MNRNQASAKSPHPKTIGRYNSLLCLIWYLAYTWYITAVVITLREYGSDHTLSSDDSENGIFKHKAYLFVFHALFAMVLYCYYLTITVDAGKVPSSFKDVESGNGKEGLVERSRGGATRYCEHCRQFKPDRAHHCRTCNRCFLKMDHHCPWSNSCVGYYNYKYYLLLLLYGFLGISFVLITQFRIAYNTYYIEERNWTDTAVLFNYFCSLVMMFSVVWLGSFHMMAVLKNLTTLEWMEKKRLYSDFENFYDLGPIPNWIQVFGDNPFLWVLPTRYGIVGDGVNFATRPVTM